MAGGKRKSRQMKTTPQFCIDNVIYMTDENPNFHEIIQRKLVADEKPILYEITSQLRATTEDINSVNIRQNPRNVKKPMHWTCEICGKEFVRKFTLKRHAFNMHGTKVRVREVNSQNNNFTCPKCGKQFTRKYSLKRHLFCSHLEKIQNKGEFQIGNLFTCNECGEQFVIKYLLMQHLNKMHPETIRIIKEKPTSFPCEICGVLFSLKYTLKRHIASKHPKRILVINDSVEIVENVEHLFKCAECGRGFNRKDIMKRHILQKHMPELEEFLFECEHCSKTFKSKDGIACHMRLRHSSPRIHSIKPAMKCLRCEENFLHRDVLFAHYRKVHGIQFEYEEHQFNSADEFERWKKNMQRSTMTQFMRKTSWKRQSHIGQRFYCHRSGHYVKRATLRRSKLKGTKKLQGICPAELFVRIKDNRYSVTFQKKHVGHEVGNLEEMCHISLDDEDKLFIAAELSAGVSWKHILQKSRLNDGENNDRMRFLRFQDCANIASKFRIPYRKCFATSSITSNGDSFEMQKKEAILYVKDKFTADEWQLLDDNDFMIVLMDETQEQYLRRYGHKVICLDGAYGMTQCEFAWHTLLVEDIECEGFPVAFALSNRTDKVVIDIFLRCIRERVGTIKPKTVITDLENSYHDSWNIVMEPPTFSLFCSRHVREAWRRDLKFIVNCDKKEAIRHKLNSLLEEIDPIVFEEELNKFLKINDVALNSFIADFSLVYPYKKQFWAYCYRQHAGINTNAHIETFHRRLKRDINNGKKIESLREAIQCLEKYLIYKDNDIMVKNLMGKRLTKLDDLNRNHKIALEYCGKEGFLVEIVDHKTWYVQSSQVTENVIEMYVVEKNEPIECRLYNDYKCQLFCEECDKCFHEYRCSCLDSSVSNSMCQHIHMLGISERFARPQEQIKLEMTSPLRKDCFMQRAFEMEEEKTVERVKIHALQDLQEAFALTTNLDDVLEIHDQSIKPLLQARKSST